MCLRRVWVLTRHMPPEGAFVPLIADRHKKSSKRVTSVDQLTMLFK